MSELDRPFGERSLEGADVEAVVLERHGDELDAGALEQQQRAVIGRLLDDHAVSGFERVAEQERRRLHRAVGEHHLLGGEPMQLGAIHSQSPGCPKPVP